MAKQNGQNGSTKRPKAGERTRHQTLRGGGSGAGGTSGLLPGLGAHDLNAPFDLTQPALNTPALTTPVNVPPGLAGVVRSSAGTVGTQPSTLSILIGRTQVPGYRDPQPGDYRTYREMESNATVALAIAVFTGPIKAAAWGFEAREGTPKERIDFIKDVFEPMRPLLLQEALRALGSGWRPFEKVYEAKQGGRWAGKWWLNKLKPLLPDLTRVVVERATGAFRGVIQGSEQTGTYLPPEKSFVYTYDGEAGDFYGRSRHENIRQAWSYWQQANETSGKLGTKVSSILPIVKFPSGESRTNDENEIAENTEENRRIAQTIIDYLQIAKGVAFETETFDDADLRANPDLAKVTKWDIDTVDTGQSAAAVGGLVEERRYYDILMFRGWLVPERTAQEGQHGTLAESEAQADFALTGSELVHQDICRQLNWYVVDDLLALNFGEEARGSVWIKPAPIVDRRRAIIKEFFAAMLANPAVFELVLSEVNRGTIYDTLEFPAEATEAAPVLTAPPGDEDDAQRQAGGNRAGSAIAQAREEDEDDDAGEQLAMRFDALLDRLELNCGTGAGGFQPGNTCARGGDGQPSPPPTGRVFNAAYDDGPAGRPPGAGQRIKPPTGPGDFDRFVAEVEQTPEYQEAVRRLDAAAQQTTTGNPTQWSRERNQVNGQWTEQRRAIHEQIIRDTLTPASRAAAGEQPVAVLLIGPPGAGKTTAGAPYTKRFGVEFAVINPDDVKAALPEYEGWNAALVHEESGDVAENMILPRAMADRHNLLMDATGKSGKKMAVLAQELSDAGHDVHVVFVNVPPHLSTARAWERFQSNAFRWNDASSEPGRFVPPRYAYLDVDGHPERTYRILKDMDAVSSWVSLDNDVPRGTAPIVRDEGERRPFRGRKVRS